MRLKRNLWSAEKEAKVGTLKRRDKRKVGIRSNRLKQRRYTRYVSRRLVVNLQKGGTHKQRSYITIWTRKLEISRKINLKYNIIFFLKKIYISEKNIDNNLRLLQQTNWLNLAVVKHRRRNRLIKNFKKFIKVINFRKVNKVKGFTKEKLGIKLKFIRKLLDKNRQLKNYLKLFKILKVGRNSLNIERIFLNLILKKLNTIFWLKRKTKIFKIYTKLVLRKLLKLPNKNFFGVVNTKQNYRVKYIYKYINLNGLCYTKKFKLVYKKNIFIKNYLSSNILLRKEIINKKLNNKGNLKKKLFLLQLLRIERSVLDYAKGWLDQDLKCKYYFVTNYNFTAELLARYICIKLKQRFTLQQTIRPLINYLSRDILVKKILFGYRIQCTGRFTRRQRATYLVFKEGKVPLATIQTKIDYAADYVVLKDGVGSIKVWLYQTDKFQEAVVRFVE